MEYLSRYGYTDFWYLKKYIKGQTVGAKKKKKKTWQTTSTVGEVELKAQGNIAVVYVEREFHVKTSCMIRKLL